MTTFTELLEKEESAIVRAVLGHWLFGFIHPYMDGNGRMARFLMNLMMASGGYAYAEWEHWKDKAGVSFYLRERQPVELLKVRLQGQQLLALREGEEFDPLKGNGDEAGAQRRAKVAAAGSYQKVRHLEGGERRQKGSGRWQLRKPNAESGDPAPHTHHLPSKPRRG